MRLSCREHGVIEIEAELGSRGCSDKHAAKVHLSIYSKNPLRAQRPADIELAGDVGRGSKKAKEARF